MLAVGETSLSFSGTGENLALLYVPMLLVGGTSRYTITCKRSRCSPRRYPGVHLRRRRRHHNTFDNMGDHFLILDIDPLERRVDALVRRTE